jgi:hypothetical protein
MANDKITISDALTGETIEREMTAEEQAARDAFLVVVRAEELEAAKPPTLAEKLDSIGLTLPELKKALGL